MGRITGTFSEAWAYRNSTGLTSTQSKYLNMQREDSLSFDVGDTLVSNLSYKNFNVNNFTYAFKIQHYSTGGTQYYLDWYGNSSNYVSCYLSGGTIYLKHSGAGTTRTVSITPTINASIIYYLIFRGDANATIDGTNYLKTDFGESSSATTGGTASALGTIAAADTTFSVGQTWRNRGQNVFQGRMWLWILNYAWSDSEVTSFINSGVPSEPIADQNTLFMMNGELSSGYPQAVYFDSSGATYCDTLESGVGNYTGIDATVSDETSNPIAEAHSMSVAAVTGGGYSYRTFTVTGSTTYSLDVIVKGVSGETVGVLVEGDSSGTINYRTITADGTNQKIGLTFTTGSGDSSIEVRFFDNLDSSHYYWNGEFCAVNDWNQITLNWNDMT